MKRIIPILTAIIIIIMLFTSCLFYDESSKHKDSFLDTDEYINGYDSNPNLRFSSSLIIQSKAKNTLFRLMTKMVKCCGESK